MVLAPATDRSRVSSVVVAAIAIASAGAGGIGAGAAGSSASSTVAESVAGRNIAARKPSSKRSASRGNADEAYRRLGMRGVRRAVEQNLDDVHGTGNVSPPGGVLLGIADVRFTGQHYQSRRAGAVTVIAEAEPLAGPVEDAVLDAVAEVAVLLPKP